MSILSLGHLSPVAREPGPGCYRLLFDMDFLKDVRYGWRGLWRSRAFAATTVATLAVGLALVTVVFTIFDAYVLRPFAVRDPFSLYQVAWRSQEAGGRAFRWRDYEALRNRADLFNGVVAERTQFVTGEGGRIAASFVSVNYFDIVGARVALGRTIATFDAASPGGQPVVVLTHQAWTRLFDADPMVVGRSLTLSGQPFVVIGVMAKEFVGLDDSPRDLWMPITMYPSVMRQDLFGPAQPREVAITVRVRREVTAEQVQSVLTPFMIETINRADEVRAQVRPQATPAPFSLDLIAMLSPVFAVFGLVLAAACANVSNIMLARANARHREIGVRLSLGASRGRVIRQLLTEGLMIAGLAGIVGLALAALVLRAGTGLLFLTLPPTAASLVRVVPLDFDYRVFIFALLVSASTTILFALVPALQATRLTLTHALRGEASARFRGATLRNALVAGQVTVSIVLLIASATIVRNGMHLRSMDIGLDTHSVFTVNQRARGGSLIDRAAATLSRDPRVAGVAITSRNPLSEQLPKTPAMTPGSPAVVVASYMFVSPEYFKLVRISLIEGRGFRPEEAQSQAAVAVVSAAAARRLWPGQDPLGRTIRVHLEPLGPQAEEIFAMRSDRRRNAADASQTRLDVTVVGVAKDVVSGLVYEGSDAAHLYLPTSATGTRANSLLVRSRSPKDLRSDTLLTLLHTVHPDPLAFDAMPLEEALAMQMFPLRVASWIGSLLSAIALALSVSGLYGVVSYGLSQRTREIGIRMALGATATAVMRMVMTQSARLVAVGAGAGVIVSLAVLATLRAVVHLDNVSILNGAAFFASVAILVSSAGFAAYFPARRASTINPSESLRTDG
jgi:putative ABC transport system permease protein